MARLYSNPRISDVRGHHRNLQYFLSEVNSYNGDKGSGGENKKRGRGNGWRTNFV